jgi:poly(3-hydroxybutyrate) depolymerase
MPRRPSCRDSVFLAWAVALVLAVGPPAAASDDPVALLRDYLAASASERPPIADQEFAAAALSRAQAEEARDLLVADWRARFRDERAPELARGEITIADRTMPIFYKTFGERPASGRSLFISMHGGGNAPPAVNDQQWRNQQRLYEPAEGVYVAPRAPTNTWNLWHEAHIDGLFDRLIEDMVLCEDVDPNRVYVMGYSAGGDGVYQLAPRMADRFAAAAMMAGHPNETSPLGLRNLPFALHVGALDAGYDRNKVAGEWKEKLAALHEGDPDGYVNEVELHEGKGHWMDREDAKAVPWMSQYARTAWPKRIVWKQDDVTHTRFYWLAVDADAAKVGAEVRADVNGQEIDVASADVPRLAIRVADALVDMDKPVLIRTGEKVLFQGVVPRTIAAMAQSLSERGDPELICYGVQSVQLQP